MHYCKVNWTIWVSIKDIEYMIHKHRSILLRDDHGVHFDNFWFVQFPIRTVSLKNPWMNILVFIVFFQASSSYLYHSEISSISKRVFFSKNICVFLSNSLHSNVFLFFFLFDLLLSFLWSILLKSTILDYQPITDKSSILDQKKQSLQESIHFRKDYNHIQKVHFFMIGK